MVSQKAIREANASTSSKQRALTAVFVGATSGIGLGTIKSLLRNTAASTIYIVGRSSTKFAPTLSELQNLDPSARITFLEGQVSLLKDVDRICTDIKAKITSLDILWLSQGGLSSAGYTLTSEGLFDDYAVAFYSRLLFMHKLVSLLKQSKTGRIISILSAGQEGPIHPSLDFSLSTPANQSALGFWGSLKQGVTMMSLAMQTLGLQNPDVVFLHTNPGFVSTPVHEKWAATMSGWLMPLSWLISWVLIPVTHFFARTPDEAGEVGLYEATNERYGAENFWRLDENAEPLVSDKGRAVIEKYESDGTRERLWEDTLKIFERVLGQ